MTVAQKTVSHLLYTLERAAFFMAVRTDFWCDNNIWSYPNGRARPNAAAMTSLVLQIVTQAEPLTNSGRLVWSGCRCRAGEMMHCSSSTMKHGKCGGGVFRLGRWAECGTATNTSQIVADIFVLAMTVRRKPAESPWGLEGELKAGKFQAGLRPSTDLHPGLAVTSRPGRAGLHRRTPRPAAIPWGLCTRSAAAERRPVTFPTFDDQDGIQSPRQPSGKSTECLGDARAHRVNSQCLLLVGMRAIFSSEGSTVAECTTPAPSELIETRDLESMKQELIKLDALPIVPMSISSLLLDTSPRQGGENDEHIRVLAESGKQLPPIIVHVPSMRVIDGIHRVRAAIMRGENMIPAKEYHGTDEDAFALAVRMNIAHGLPLTRADRTAAATRIIQSHPQWSDRMIATTVGLSPKTVTKVRHRSTVENPQSTRLGQDGRLRPVNPAAARQRVAALLADNPTSSIRTIAQQAGVSSSTVHHVRQRLRTGQHPTPDQHQAPDDRHQPSTTGADPHHGTAHSQASACRGDIAAILADLSKAPSHQTSDTTQSLLRCLDRYRIEIPQANKIIKMVPPHLASSVAQLAREYGQLWTHIATQLEQRAALIASTTIPQQRRQSSPQ